MVCWVHGEYMGNYVGVTSFFVRFSESHPWVTSKNARKLIDCGADVLVAGSFVFKSENPTQTISELKKI